MPIGTSTFKAKLRFNSAVLTDSQRENLCLAVGRLLREEREKQGLSKKALSEQSGVSRSMILRIETGERYATVDTIYRLAAVLKLDPGYFLSTPWGSGLASS